LQQDSKELEPGRGTLVGIGIGTQAVQLVVLGCLGYHWVVLVDLLVALGCRQSGVHALVMHFLVVADCQARVLVVVDC
jgi:hypothetical protein